MNWKKEFIAFGKINKMKRRENSDSYYQSQNGRSGMDNDANEIKKYFNDLDINITNDFYFLDVGCRAKARTVSFMNKKGANSYGFEITYKTDGILRKKEPWHLFYK